MSDLEKKVKDVPKIDPDLSPDNPMNKEAASKLGLSYDSKTQTYKDSDGYSVRDKYGQHLG